MLDSSHTPAYAVLRFKKLRTLGKITKASRHNTRTAASGIEHTQPPTDRPGVVWLDGKPDARAAWQERAAAVGLGKPRRDAVLAVEIVMSASPIWFDNATPAEQADWTARSMAYAREVFGPDNILQAVRHDDEKTPHIHVIGIPLEQKQRARAGRPRKGREGAKRPAALSWGLNADRLIGNPDTLREHQTVYAAQLADLGIRRGRPKHETGAKHKPPTVFRAELAAAVEEARERTQAAREREKAARSLPARQAEAFTMGLDAVEQGDLYVNEQNALRPKERDRVVLPNDEQGMMAWVSAALPFFNTLKGYAKRIADLRHREAKVAKDAAAIARVAERQAQHEAVAAQNKKDRPALSDHQRIQRILNPYPLDPRQEFSDPPGVRRNPYKEPARGRERER